MAEQRGERERWARRKEILKGILGGLGVVLVPAAIIAGAVLWRASWYYQ